MTINPEPQPADDERDEATDEAQQDPNASPVVDVDDDGAADEDDENR